MYLLNQHNFVSPTESLPGLDLTTKSNATPLLSYSRYVFTYFPFTEKIFFMNYLFLQIKEMQYIMNSMTPTSLIIIDELCRGTSTEEGTSIAWAICEKLLATKVFVFLTTHFLYLTKLQDLYCNVVKYVDYKLQNV